MVRSAAIAGDAARRSFSVRRTSESWQSRFGESIALRYPRDVHLTDGFALTLTPMVPSDCQFLQRFLEAVPQPEQRFFREDASVAERVERWCTELDYRNVIPLLAWHGDQIVGDATLEQEPGLWTAHVAKVRLMVHPDFRRRGLGRRLLDELIELGRELGLHKLVYECAAEQRELTEHLMRSKFIPAARLADFIRDRNGRLHDMVILVRDLSR